MKTENNAQEKFNNQVSGLIFRGITVIVSVVLISWTVGAQNFWEQVLTSQNVDNTAMIGTENPFERSQVNLMTATFDLEEAAPEISSDMVNLESVEEELELQFETYNASDYVDSEISQETENYRNTGSEASFESIELSLEQQVEPYIANEFVESELSGETENWINSNTEFNFKALGDELELQVEKYNAADFADAEFTKEPAGNASNNTVSYDTIEAELEVQVVKYDASVYVDAEILNEAELNTNADTNETLEAVLVPQMDHILKYSEYNPENFVGAEMAREIESKRAQDEFLNKAESETAREADQEVEKYAMLMVSHLNNTSK
jgi:hypothetical protein